MSSYISLMSWHIIIHHTFLSTFTLSSVLVYHVSIWQFSHLHLTVFRWSSGELRVSRFARPVSTRRSPALLIALAPLQYWLDEDCLFVRTESYFHLDWHTHSPSVRVLSPRKSAPNERSFFLPPTRLFPFLVLYLSLLVSLSLFELSFFY